MEEQKNKAKRGVKPAAQTQEERITQLPLSELHDFPNHPFKVLDNLTAPCYYNLRIFSNLGGGHPAKVCDKAAKGLAGLS